MSGCSECMSKLKKGSRKLLLFPPILNFAIGKRDLKLKFNIIFIEP
jgi:hypothetical protein